MGMFSDICPKCGKAIVSIEEADRKYRDCIIFVKKNGEILERQEGLYDGYGFSGDYSVEGEPPHVWACLEWGEIVSLNYDEDEDSGMLYFHKECYCIGDEHRYNTSEDDPNQGWQDPDGEEYDDQY